MSEHNGPKFSRRAAETSKVAASSVTVHFSKGVTESFRQLQSAMSSVPHISNSARDMLDSLASGRPIVLDDLLGTLPILAADASESDLRIPGLAVAWRDVAAQMIESTTEISVDKSLGVPRR